jgi:hypothetical protein
MIWIIIATLPAIRPEPFELYPGFATESACVRTADRLNYAFRHPTPDMSRFDCAMRPRKR